MSSWRIPNYWCRKSVVKEGGGDNLQFLGVACTLQSPCKELTVCKGRKGSNFAVEKPDQHSLSQTIQAIIKSQILLMACTPNMIFWKWFFTSGVSLITHTHSRIIRKALENFQWRISYKITDQHTSKLSRL